MQAAAAQGTPVSQQPTPGSGHAAASTSLLLSSAAELNQSDPSCAPSAENCSSVPCPNLDPSHLAATCPPMPLIALRLPLFLGRFSPDYPVLYSRHAGQKVSGNLAGWAAGMRNKALWLGLMS